MKALGIAKGMDSLGRIVLPMELRRAFGLEKGTKLEIFTDKDCIILKKYQTGCIICGSGNADMKFKDKYICEPCMGDLKEFTSKT